MLVQVDKIPPEASAPFYNYMAGTFWNGLLDEPFWMNIKYIQGFRDTRTIKTVHIKSATEFQVPVFNFISEWQARRWFEDEPHDEKCHGILIIDGNKIGGWIEHRHEIKKSEYYNRNRDYSKIEWDEGPPKKVKPNNSEWIW